MSCESFKLPRINSCSQNQSAKQKTPLSDTQTRSHDAQKSRGHFMRDSNHLRRLSAVVSQATIRKLPSVQDICDACIVMSVLKWTDGTHQTRLPHSRFAGCGCARKPDQTAGRGGVQESHQTF